ncbi:MAG: toll/interleukin-1 receptor domain-containing protein [Microthrixaceae bacterium]|nr:toll/interleukin-1 receptor domain-containing protein [Microthrixaceae bacterium]
MTVIYEIQVLQVDRPGWLADLRQAVAQELLDIGMHSSVDVAVTETATPGGPAPSVGVVLVGPQTKGDGAIADGIQEATAAGMVLIPVVDDLTTFDNQVPVGLARLNGFEWVGANPAQRLARLLLEELGIEDRDRRVFISHRRSDGLGAAEQLHDHLSHHRFVPFIDRFAIPKGADVQDHIADGLEQHAFLLLLETPDAYLSEWVFLEVDYALSHTMGTIIVSWPGNPTPLPGSAGIPRIILDPSDLTTDDHGFDVLTEAALDRLIRKIEAAHAHGIVRRRRMLVCSVEDAARAKQGTSVALKDWTLDIDGPQGRTIVAIAPRLPSAGDLQRLDQTRAAIDADAEALLVHATRHLRESDLEHLRWVTGDRNLDLLPENAIGGHW